MSTPSCTRPRCTLRTSATAPDSEFERVNVDATRALADAGGRSRRPPVRLHEHDGPLRVGIETAELGRLGRRGPRAAARDDLPPDEGRRGSAPRGGCEAGKARGHRAPDVAVLPGAGPRHGGVSAAPGRRRPRRRGRPRARAGGGIAGLPEVRGLGRDAVPCGGLGDLLRDAPSVLRRRAPELVEAFGRRGWSLPVSIDRVYSPERAMQELGWRPRYGFVEVLKMLDEDRPRSLRDASREEGEHEDQAVERWSVDRRVRS